MSDFKILENGEKAECLYGIENKEITELELEALLEGKRLWTDINWEYAITIRLKDRLNELDLDRENRELKSQLQQKENIIKEVREYLDKYSRYCSNKEWFSTRSPITDLKIILDKVGDEK